MLRSGIVNLVRGMQARSLRSDDYAKDVSVVSTVIELPPSAIRAGDIVEDDSILQRGWLTVEKIEQLVRCTDNVRSYRPLFKEDATTPSCGWFYDDSDLFTVRCADRETATLRVLAAPTALTRWPR